MKRIIYTLLGMMLSVGAWAQTLQEQINSAEAGATITLTENVTISQTILIDKNITIDGGNHTIKSSVNNKLGTFYINTGTCNFTIQNATIDGGSAASMAVVAYRGKANSGLTTVDSGDRDNNNSGNVINMTDCNVKNFTGFPSSYAGAVYVFGKSSATLTNCTFSGNTTSLQSTDGASGADVWAGAAATVNISGGSYQEVFVNSDKTSNASITISGGATIEELAVCVTENTDGTTSQPHITIDNATVTNLVTETGNDLPSSAVITTNGGSVINMPGNYVAQIGDKRFATLGDAVAAVPADGTKTTIKMLADVDLTATVATVYGQNVILDLNNHNITSTVIAIKNLGDLEVTGTGSITVNGTKNTLYGISNAGAAGKKANLIIGENVTVTAPCVAVYTNYGKTTVNGTLANTQADASNIYSTLRLSQASSEVIVAASAKVTGVVNAIYGDKGTLEVNSTNVGKIYADGSATQGLKIKKTAAIEGLNVYGHAEFSDNADYYVAAKAISACTGTVKLLSDINAALAVSANKTVTLDLNGHKVTAENYAVAVDGNLTITGEGTVQSTGMGSDSKVQAAVYVKGVGNLTILSGNYVAGFEGEEGNPAVYVKDNAVVEIKGGDFVGGSKYLLNKLDASRETSTIEVTGGTFHNNFDPANNTNDGGSESYGTNYVADGYITEMTESGSDRIYTVKEGVWIAKIEGGVDSKFRFATLDDAITAANGAGKDVTITLLADATATEAPASNVTIDAASHALTLPSFNVADGAELSYAKVTNATDNTYKVTNATYNRTGAVGTQWGTACLPFSFESAPEGYTLYTPSAVGDNELTVTAVTYPVAAGTPVIFHKNSTADATMTMTSSEASVKIGATPVAQSGTVSLVGTFTEQNISTGLSSIYFINGDKFHQAKASLKVPAYRAYINYSAPGAAPAVLQLVVDEESSAIADVAADLNGTQAIYDVNGRQLAAPQKGINIMKLANGKTVKLIIK